MSADHETGSTQGEAVFTWHPEYQGRSLAKLTRDLESEIARDQRAYELALSGAEESEHDALASVVDVDRRWSTYHFGWNEANPAEVAERVAAFEWEREQRQEMISWKDYRKVDQPTSARASTGQKDWRSSMDDAQRRKTANLLAGVIMALIVVAMIAVLVLVL